MNDMGIGNRLRLQIFTPKSVKATRTWASAWMLVPMSPLATWEMTKLMVEAVLLWRSSKCGETERILGGKRRTEMLRPVPGITGSDRICVLGLTLARGSSAAPAARPACVGPGPAARKRCSGPARSCPGPTGTPWGWRGGHCAARSDGID